MTPTLPKKNLATQQCACHKPETTDSHGAILDEHGNEISITENMIIEACETLHREWGSVFRSRNTTE